MTRVFDRKSIEAAVVGVDVIAEMEAGFLAYGKDQAVVPPVGELVFEQPPGDVHIKYGYIRGESDYVIKIASGFYENPKQGLPTSDGMMLVFDQATGRAKGVLLDEGYLTDIRTAAAGALVARYLAPKTIEAIGILGTGVQARLQAQYLKGVTTCRRLFMWGRRTEAAEAACADLARYGFETSVLDTPQQVAKQCNLIVTTTPSRSPLLLADQVRPGTHITAMGSDTSHKQELDGAILGSAGCVISDSLSQSESRGEVFRAVASGHLSRDKVVSLGALVANPNLGRRDETAITVADLTGVAVQDIRIATAVLDRLLAEHPG